MWKNVLPLGCERAFLCWRREASWGKDSKVRLLGLFVLLEITSVTVSEMVIASCVSVSYRLVTLHPEGKPSKVFGCCSFRKTMLLL